MTSAHLSNDDTLRRVILDLLAQRQDGKTICPSEAARAIAGSDEQQWRRLMKPIRAVAVAMAHAGEIDIRRKGRTVDPDNFRGIYRLALPAPKIAEPSSDVAQPGPRE